ncbi:MAG: prepilin-type N-terminal cleavage/methylation domain-containing protein [Patescibacteria group bacterium]
MTKKIKKLNKGFTLIELLVVVAIIAILALIVLLALNPVEMARKSRDSRRLSDLGTLRRAIDLSLADGETLTAKDITVNTATLVTNFDGSGLDISKYLSVVPQDPINDGSTASLQVATKAVTDCAAGTDQKINMIYEYWSDGNVYILKARLESLDNCGAIRGDGNDNNYYEIGTAPGMLEVTP